MTQFHALVNTCLYSVVVLTYVRGTRQEQPLADPCQPPGSSFDVRTPPDGADDHHLAAEPRPAAWVASGWEGVDGATAVVICSIHVQTSLTSYSVGVSVRVGAL